MSDFSERTRDYITDAGSNVYQLSKASGLDRTTLQRMITGKRLPSIDFVKDFCGYLRVNPNERKELFRLYQIEKIGKSTYYNRNSVEGLLSCLNKLDRHFSDITITDIYAPAPENTFSSDVIERIDALLEQVFASELPSVIYTNLPADRSIFFNMLRHKRQKYSRAVPVRHMFALRRNPKDVLFNVNLRALSNVLPFALSDYVSYQPYYYYSGISLNEKTMELFPYCVAAGQKILFISSDLRVCVESANNKIIAQIIASFHHALSLATPLLKKTNGTDEFAKTWFNSLQNYGLPIYSVESQPNFLSMLYSRSLLNEIRLMDENLSREIKEKLGDAAAQLSESEEPFYNFFSMYGIQSFIKTGKIEGSFGWLNAAFPPERRKRMIEHMFSALLLPMFLF